jgi:dUTP pyrophosphatase
MFPVTIKFVKTHPDAMLPAYNHSDPYIGDSGLDLVAVEDKLIDARGSGIVDVGLQLAYITPGYWFRVEGRSGLGFKFGVQPHFGIIDNPYRGNMGIKLYNQSDIPYQVTKGNKIAQIIVYPLIQANVDWATEVTETARGEKGFGSSDKK